MQTTCPEAPFSHQFSSTSSRVTLLLRGDNVVLRHRSHLLDLKHNFHRTRKVTVAVRTVRLNSHVCFSPLRMRCKSSMSPEQVEYAHLTTTAVAAGLRTLQMHEQDMHHAAQNKTQPVSNANTCNTRIDATRCSRKRHNAAASTLL